MSYEGIRRFLRDESGAYTVWSLLWFMVYVAIGGLAVDMSDGYRTKAILQSTADAAALAAIMSLPDQADGRLQAVNFSYDNMLQNIHGTAVRPEDVVFGTWVFSPGGFSENAVDPNAVRVLSRRAGANENPLATNFLRIIGLLEWDVNAVAIAARFVPECLRQGNSFVAGNRVDITSNNVLDNTCVHGQNMYEDPAHDYAVEIQNNGIIYDDTQISMPNLEDMIDRPTICSNEGLCEEGAVVYGDMMPRDALLIDDMIAGMLDTTSTDYLPGDLYGVDAETSEIILPTYNNIDLNNCANCTAVPPPPDTDPTAPSTFEYTAVMQPNNVYVFTCNDPMDLLILPDPALQPILQDVAIISECRVNGQSNMHLEGVAIASSAMGGGSKGYQKATIKFPAGTQYGRDDNCAPGGGVQLYTRASVQISSAGPIDGMRIVAGGDVELTANLTADDINVEAGHNIKFTANADVGTGCVGDVEGHIAWHYRLVH